MVDVVNEGGSVLLITISLRDNLCHAYFIPSN